MFAYYAKWIHGLTDKIQPMLIIDKFLLEKNVLNAFNQKRELEGATLQTVDENLPFEVECTAFKD